MAEIAVYPQPSGGEPIWLSPEDRVGSGGEGKVYVAKKPQSKEKIAIKIFSEKKLSDSGLFRKISAMVEMGNRNNKALIKHSRIAWPQLSIFDKNERFVGYAMKRAQGMPLTKLAHPKVYENHFSDMNREKVSQMLICLWKSVKFLHERDIYIGDINLNNVMCSPSYKTCWIDVDSFQIGNPDNPASFYPCPVGRPELTPPEHQGTENYAEIRRTRESDLFSLAILSFQCLMLGRHPFEHIGGGSPVDNLRKGRVPYLSGGSVPGSEGAVPPGPWYNTWDWYIYDVKNLFQRALRDGLHDARLRPSADEWIKALNAYIYRLNNPGEKFSHRWEMMPDEPKPRGQDHRDTRDVRPTQQR